MTVPDLLRALAAVADVIERQEGKNSESVAVVLEAISRLQSLNDKIKRVRELPDIWKQVTPPGWWGPMRQFTEDLKTALKE